MGVKLFKNLFGKGKKDTKSKKSVRRKTTRKVKAKEIGAVIHYFGKISVGIIKLKAKLDVGDRIEIRGAHVDFSQPVKSMQINHQRVASAKKGVEVGVKVKKRVHPNDKVYKEAS